MDSERKDTKSSYGDKDLFHEINFDLLRSQSNIYGVSCFKQPNQASSKLLVSLLEGRIFMWEYIKQTNNEMKCLSKEVAFTYIPGNCHIISIDSFSCEARGLVVGVTFCKESNEKFLNIYYNYDDDVPVGQEWNLDHVAQNRRSFEINFTPYQLTHCKVYNPKNGEYKTVFILLGSDEYFHVYAQSKTKGDFINESAKAYFVELGGNYGIPTYLEIRNIGEKRISVIGNSIGGINVFLVDTIKNMIVSSWSMEHDSPIAQCHLFTELKLVHLVVISARELAVVYENILENGLKNPLILEKSDSYDCVTCCDVSDINYDGCKEVLIGTYGSELLAYSFKNKSDECKSLSPIWTRTFSAPVLKVKLVDLIGDGVNEMVVVTTNGVHMMQLNLSTLLDLCKLNLGLE